ncbi:hypothetical protein BJV82DRAFT_100599 [Fennellomyces sp. T-0311]|nr:hypothetical protein BJV82DRAFT_100599 [Fennellomyces sp. T-0311]
MVIQELSVTARNEHYGRFATTSKLIASLVSEGLASGYFIQDAPHERNSNSVGLCLVTPLLQPDTTGLFKLDDVYAVIPLRGLPELKDTASSLNGIKCHHIELVYPWDMLPHIYGPIPMGAAATEQISTSLIVNGSDDIHRQVSRIVSKIFKHENDQSLMLTDDYDAVDLWSRFVQAYGVDEKPATEFAEDFATSMLYQTYQYNHPKPLPSLQSSSVEWEQSIIEGHPFIPLSKYPSAVLPMQPLAPDQYSIDFERPKVRLVAIPRKHMYIYGDVEDTLAPVINAILAKTEDFEEQYFDYFLMPVHHMQVANIQEKVPEVFVLPKENHVDAYGLSSLRTVAIPGLLHNATLKLTFGLRMGGAIRAIQSIQIYAATTFSLRVVPYLSYNRDILTIQVEQGGAIYNHPQYRRTMNDCSFILRTSMEYGTASSDDVFIVTGALMEKIQRPDTDETLVSHAWNLDTEEKRAHFLGRYIALYLEAFVPPCRDNGVVFDAHGQNTIARFDRSTGALKGFLIRDMDGVLVQRETLKESCGIDFFVDSFNSATSKEHAYAFFYFVSIETHLQCLIRILGMHHNGRGWQMVRTHLSNLLTPGHPMYTYLLEQKEVLSMCFIRTKLENAYNNKIKFTLP